MERTPGSSSASRMRKLRQKRTQEDPDFQKNENARISELRRKKKQTMSESMLIDVRTRKREEKRLERRRKKIQNSITDPSTQLEHKGTSSSFYPYKCQQTYSKAIIKCMRSLPSGIDKQKCVIKGVAERIGINVVEKIHINLQEDEEKPDSKIVKDFFYQPNVVYTCPGMKDSMAVWKNGKKITMQKHYLTLFLKEAYAIFGEEHPNIKIGFSKFCSLRPPNVLLLKDTPSEQCKCKIHENFTMKLSALKITYCQKFWDDMLCNTALNSSCWQNECEDCANLKRMSDPEDISRIVVWKEWLTNEQNKTTLSLRETSEGELLEAIKESYNDFVYHVLLKRIQSERFLMDKNESNTRILQIDFAMSYSCEYQNEIQSALWARSSVTLFTAAVFFKNQCKSFVICSDCHRKDKDSIFVFINHLYDLIITNDANEVDVQDVIWSDGPASEFKNKFMVKLLHHMFKKYKKTFIWRYSATSHGKGVIDGIGGNVKRLVKQRSMAQNGVIVQSAEDFANLASTLVPSTNIIYISEATIRSEITSKNPWANVDTIRGISRFHEVICNSDYVKARKHCLEDQQTVFRLKPQT